MGEYKRKPFSHILEQLFFIPNKRGEIVPFVLNKTQLLLHDLYLQHDKLDILKCRQRGATTFFLGTGLVECMTSFCSWVLIAHDKFHTQKLLERAKLMLELMRGPKPQVKRMNDQEIYFSKTKSTLFIGTAGSSNFGRSTTITHLHASEVAFWPEPESLMAGLMQAIPLDGVIIKESTANGYGTWHHLEYLKAQNGKSPFFPVFIGWNIDEEYSLNPEDIGLTPELLTPEELKLMQTHNLTIGQIAWRRLKISELGESLFKQEYPIVAEEAFLKSGLSFFNEAHFKFPEEEEYGLWHTEQIGEFKLSKHIHHPHPNMEYVIGCDPAGGTGRDFTVIQGICLDTREQVFCIWSNEAGPSQIAKLLIELGREYNEALLVVENNSLGMVLNDELKRTYKMGKLYWEASVNGNVRFGFTTGAKSKTQLLHLIREYGPYIKIFDPTTIQQIKAFPNSKEDDFLMAFGLACAGLKKLRWEVSNGKERQEEREKEKVGGNGRGLKRARSLGVGFDDIFYTKQSVVRWE